MKYMDRDTDLLIYNRDIGENTLTIQLTKNPAASRKRPAAAISAPSPGECMVCMDAAVSHVMIPCGHLCVCEQCVAILRVNPCQTCPHCRSSMQKVYIIWRVHRPMQGILPLILVVAVSRGTARADECA